MLAHFCSDDSVEIVEAHYIVTGVGIRRESFLNSFVIFPSISFFSIPDVADFDFVL